MKLRFACPACAAPAFADATTPREWQCSRCDHLLRIVPLAGAQLTHCLICGNEELYKKKDFPHWLGMSILIIACAAFILGNLLYHQWLAWAVLIASAAFDGLLYLWVGDAVVCYRCRCEHCNLAAAPRQAPFELTVAERYRQERIRKELLREEKTG